MTAVALKIRRPFEDTRNSVFTDCPPYKLPLIKQNQENNA